MKCTFHPNVETNLRCGKCGKPICPKCMVETPVGARCRDCARVTKLPTFALAAKHYWRAALVGTGMAFALGAAWWGIKLVMPYIYFNFLLAAGFGYVMSEVIGLAVNRKRSRWLAVIAGVCLVGSFMISLSLFPVLFGGLGRFGMLDPLAVSLGVWLAVNRLR